MYVKRILNMVQRTMGVLRVPGHVYISFLNFYTM